MSQITTHVLDTTRGQPAEGITIILFEGSNDKWTEMARGITAKDGRLTDLMPAEKQLPQGIYKLRFDTKDYFVARRVTTFYPFIEIVFDLTSSAHYHIPLLLNPFGYSTYRGS